MFSKCFQLFSNCFEDLNAFRMIITMLSKCFPNLFHHFSSYFLVLFEYFPLHLCALFLFYGNSKALPFAVSQFSFLQRSRYYFTYFSTGVRRLVSTHPSKGIWTDIAGAWILVRHEYEHHSGGTRECMRAHNRRRVSEVNLRSGNSWFLLQKKQAADLTIKKKLVARHVYELHAKRSAAGDSMRLACGS